MRHYHWLCGTIRRHTLSCTLTDLFPQWRCTPYPSDWAQTPACPGKELPSAGLARSGWSLKSHSKTQIDMNESRCHWSSQLSSWDTVFVRQVLPTLHRPEHRVVIAVGDSSWVCKTGSPQAGPVPGHLDDGGAPHAPDCCDLPALHGHGAGHKDPAQNCHQETPDLDHTDLHLRCVSRSPVL